MNLKMRLFLLLLLQNKLLIIQEEKFQILKKEKNKALNLQNQKLKRSQRRRNQKKRKLRKSLKRKKQKVIFQVKMLNQLKHNQKQHLLLILILLTREKVLQVKALLVVEVVQIVQEVEMKILVQTLFQMEMEAIQLFHQRE